MRPIDKHMLSDGAGGWFIPSTDAKGTDPVAGLAWWLLQPLETQVIDGDALQADPGMAGEILARILVQKQISGEQLSVEQAIWLVHYYERLGSRK